MRGLRTVPHLWSICEDMLAVCPDALMLQYVNPMAINTWAISARYPAIKQVGLCHSVQGTAEVLARDLEISVDDLRYTAAGINHMAFFLKLQERRSRTHAVSTGQTDFPVKFHGENTPALPGVRKGKSGRLLRRPQPDHPAATVDEFCTAVLT